MSFKPKTGKCKDCEKKKNIYAKGLCNYCYAKQYQKAYRAKARAEIQAGNNKPKKEGKRPLAYLQNKSNRRYISKVSEKRASQLRKYYVLRRKYLADNQVCEVSDCNNYSNQIHHKAGRENERLIDVNFFMACCEICHPRRIHETEVDWAKKMGYLLPKMVRLSKIIKE